MASSQDADDYHLLFNSLFEGLVIAQMIFDDQAQPVDYTVLEAHARNDSHLYGKLDQIFGRRVREFKPQVDPEWIRRCGNAVKTDIPDKFEQFNESLNRWFEVRIISLSHDNKFAFIFSDINERKRAEGALQESEERYRALVKHAPAGIYEVDFRNNRFLSVNDLMCDMTGYTKEEFLKMNPFDILDDEGKVTFSDRMKQWLRGEEPEPNIDYKIKTKSGNVIYASLNVSFTNDKNGNPLGATAVGHDVTQRRKMEEELIDSEKKAQALISELEKADKNKNQFISVLSHELRNPLAVIVASLSLLELTTNPEQLSRTREIVKSQVSQLRKLVDDLLDLTRINQNKIKLKKENVNLNELLKNTIRDMRLEYTAKGVRLRSRLPKIPVLLSVDHVRIAQCVGNLLRNALEYTQATGKVALSLESDGCEAVIRIKDNGIGISSDLIEHIFEPFTQADTTLDRGNSGGLGLGLAIVDGIVRLHGGSVSAFSEGPGYGSLFTIRLPIFVQAADIKINASTNKTDRVFRILLIEDNENLAEVLCTIFALTGHQIYAAQNGAEGISKAKSVRPDVIFCDIGLPGMNGYEVARILKSDLELKDAYLIALTGYASENDIEKARESGFDNHLAKPVDALALEKILAGIHEA